MQSNKLSLNIVKAQTTTNGSAQKLGQMNKTSDITPCFQVNVNELDIVPETKYLGVMLDEKLKWNNQAKFLQKKMSQALGLLKYAKQFVHESTLRNMYLSIVEPNLSYCSSVWGCCSDAKLNTLQKLQNRAARIVTNSPFDSSAAPLLQRLGWLLVDRLIHREASSMVFKSLPWFAPDNLFQIFSRLSDVHNRALRNTKCDLAIPPMRTAYRQNSFAYRGITTCSNLQSSHSERNTRLILDFIQGKLF